MRLLNWLRANEPDEQLDVQIADLLSEMTTVGVNSENYEKYLSYVERLKAIKTKTRRDAISRDTILTVFGNLVGILIIVGYEQKHVITSRAFGELIRTSRNS